MPRHRQAARTCNPERYAPYSSLPVGGKTTYVVEMQTKDGEMDVVIDIQTGEVLAIEQ